MGVSPIWVATNRAAKFPEVIKVYKRAGGGGAGGPANGAKGFLKTVKAAVLAASSWVRKAPGASNDWQDSQVDVTNIPGVRPLNDNGKWQSFTG